MRNDNNKPEEDIKLPDFLVRDREQNRPHKQIGGSSISSYDEPFSPFAKPPMEPRIPEPINNVEKEEEDEDLGFDVDELVKKIDAKIAELEAEEKKEQEEKDKKKKEEERRTQQMREQPRQPIINKVEENKEPIERLTPEKPIENLSVEKKEPINLDLEDGEEDDDFFDDFFDN